MNCLSLLSQEDHSIRENPENELQSYYSKMNEILVSQE